LRDAAARVGALLPRERLEPAVLAWMRGRRRDETWGVGFSGGADSLALLLALRAHWPDRRRQLLALHFNHGLRGAAARADADACRRWCRVLGIRFRSARWRAPAGGASEAAAREARLAFFARHARIVWLGQQADDVAEGMLMRLARGSGTAGLAAPRPVQTFRDGRCFLRPMLGFRAAELRRLLRTAGVAWREDASNATGRYFRNRLRHQVLPRWEKASGRDAVAGATLSRQLLGEDDAALNQWLEELRPLRRDGRLELACLAGRPTALWRRALHRWLARHPAAGEPSRQAFGALLAALQRGGPCRQSLGRAGFACSDGRFLRYAIPEAKGGKKRRRAR
jgi:tRNA(Ile)-lysidine synthase